MRAVLILPFAGLIFLAGYITARYSIVNRVIDSASLLIVELGNILFRVPNPPLRAKLVALGACGLRTLVCVCIDTRAVGEDCRGRSYFGWTCRGTVDRRILLILIHGRRLENNYDGEGVFKHAVEYPPKSVLARQRDEGEDHAGMGGRLDKLRQ